MAGVKYDFKAGDDVFYHDKKTKINYINEDDTCQIDNPYWSWEEEATYVDADEDYNVPYAITVRFSELRPVLNNPHMDKETLIKCIERQSVAVSVGIGSTKV